MGGQKNDEFQRVSMSKRDTAVLFDILQHLNHHMATSYTKEKTFEKIMTCVERKNSPWLPSMHRQTLPCQRRTFRNS